MLYTLSLMDPKSVIKQIRVGDIIIVRHLNPGGTSFRRRAQLTALGRNYMTHQFIEIYVPKSKTRWAPLSRGTGSKSEHRTLFNSYHILTISLGAIGFINPTWDEPVCTQHRFPGTNNIDIWLRFLKPKLRKKSGIIQRLEQEKEYGHKDITMITRNMCIGAVQHSLGTVKIQTPDPFYRVEHSDMVGSIPNPSDPCTIEERIRKIKKHNSFILQSSITEDHIKWLKAYAKCLHKQSSIVLPGTDVWCVPKWVTDKYKFKFLARIIQYRTRRSSGFRNSRTRKRVQENNEDYQCQKFAYEFARHPKRLLRMFVNDRRLSKKDTLGMKVKKFLTFV